jgi:hypothetical protein
MIAWAAATLRHFQCTTGTDNEDALDDLLGDLLRHYSQGLFSLSNRTSLARHSSLLPTERRVLLRKGT